MMDLKKISTTDLLNELSERKNIQYFNECGLWKPIGAELKRKFVNENREIKLPLYYGVLIIDKDGTK